MRTKSCGYAQKAYRVSMGVYFLVSSWKQDCACARVCWLRAGIGGEVGRSMRDIAKIHD